MKRRENVRAESGGRSEFKGDLGVGEREREGEKERERKRGVRVNEKERRGE